MSGDSDMYWDLSTIANFNGSTLLFQVVNYDGDSGNVSFVRIWQCNNNQWIDITTNIATAGAYSSDGKWLVRG